MHFGDVTLFTQLKKESEMSHGLIVSHWFPSVVDFLSLWMHRAILWTVRKVTKRFLFVFFPAGFWQRERLISNQQVGTISGLTQHRFIDEKGVVCLGANKPLPPTPQTPTSVWKCSSVRPFNVSCVEHAWRSETAAFVFCGGGGGRGANVLTMEHLRYVQGRPVNCLHLV